MTDQQTAAAVEHADGFLRGPVRAPVNRAMTRTSNDTPRALAGSIHDDAVAQKLGFRGGTIAGSIHMDQFPPVLLAAFGTSWFETGSLSLAFKNATISGDEVVALVAEPGRSTDVQVPVRMERPDGTVVAEGTASVGSPGEPTHLESIDLRPSTPQELRILDGVRAGHRLAGHETTLDPRALQSRIDAGALTEPLPWYTGESPWGAPVANPSTIVQLLRNRSGDFGPNIASAVGLFGAIEIRHHAGPVQFGVPYRVEGEVVAVGSSPKTEYVWYDTRAFAAPAGDSERLVASMRMQLRWMKASSPQYAEP